jgi:CheY-like chemotaxis protein
MIHHAHPRSPGIVKMELRCRLRILIVDYDRMHGSSLESQLHLEHDVVRVTEASYALERLAAGEDFDLILCDLVLPHLSGPEFYKRARRVSPAAAQRVVFMARAVPARFETFVRSVSNACVQKPVVADDLAPLMTGLDVLAR